MKFTNIFSAGVIAFVACSFLPTASAAAVDVVKRDAASDAKAILDGATADIVPIKTKLLAAYNGGDLNDEAYVKDNIVPLVTDLSNVVNEAAGKITALQASGTSNSKRQVDSDVVAQALADLVEQVVEALEPLIDFLSGISIVATLLGTLLGRLDTDLNTIAVGLGILVAGVLQLVRDLLESLTNALSGLGFLNILRALGLLP